MDVKLRAFPHSTGGGKKKREVIYKSFCVSDCACVEAELYTVSRGI